MSNHGESEFRTFSREVEEILPGPGGDLQFFRYDLDQDRPNVLVLPNGYGVLEYLRTVCQQLADIGCSVNTFNFSGQGRSGGELSIESMTGDLEFVLTNAPESLQVSGDLTILAHCTAMLPLVELNKRGYDWSSVRLIILYGYLAHPIDHFARFLRKGRRYKVRVNQEPGDLPNYDPEDYAAIPVPMVVVHPRIPNNIHRASVADVINLVEVARPKAFYVPDFGYAISDHPQISSVRKIISSFVSPYISIQAQARLIGASLDTM